MDEDGKPVVRELTETRAVITGGSSGIGLETALQLARAGAPGIVINGRDERRGAAAVEKIRQAAEGSETHFVAADVSTPAGAQSLIDQAVERLGRIDLLVNAAGGDHPPRLFHDIPIEELTGIVTHYAMAPILACRAALPVMAAEHGGVIVNVASDAAKVPTVGESVIGAGMAAIAMFSRTLAMEAKRNGVRVNCLTPSLVSGTRTYDRVMIGAFSGKLFAKAEKLAHLGLATPEDQAAMVVYLASPAAARLTGQTISVNGGISAG